MSNYQRSKNYRYQFIKNNPGYLGDYRHYHCVYCGRKISKKEMQVDHVVSVYQAKHSILARLFLKINGINDVNDPKNLVPSCAKCNKRKGKYSNGWVISAIIGKNYNIWKIRKICRFLFLILLIFIIFYKIKLISFFIL